MFKKNLKKSFYLLVGLLLVGLIGLSIAMVEFDSRYQDKHRMLNRLSLEYDILQTRLNFFREKLQYYDFLSFKSDVFEQRDPQLSRITETIYKKSYQYGFRPELILGMVKVESDYNPRAVSNKGAYGLMQVNFSVWKNELSIDKKRIFDIDYNIELGLQILKRYYQESKGNIFRALHLYNNGYRYNNLSYVSKVKSQLGKFSLSAPMTVTDLENHNENVSDFSLTRQGQRSE
jgi:hypothetical protein